MEHHWKDLLPVDRYIVRQNGLIHDYDRKILTLLYQPLIGACAYSLYMTFWSILDNAFWGKESTHHSLMTITGLPLQKIYEQRKKLEGIGLLKTHVKEGDEARVYLYELQPPLSPEQFFEDDLHIFLHNQLGKNRFLSLKRYFSYKTKTEEEFRPVTSSFNEVYESVSQSEMAAVHPETEETLSLEEGYEWVSRKAADGANVTVENDDFDFELMMTHLSNLIVPKEAITDDIKEIIIKLAFIYNIEPLEMSKRIERAYMKKEQLDREGLSKEVQDWYLFEHDNQFPTLVFRNQPATQQTMKEKKPSNEEEKLIRAFETYSPAELLEVIAGGAKPAISDLKLVEAVMFEQKLMPAVVNVLIYYVLVIKEKSLSRNYVEKIANDWARKKVKTVQDAMEVTKSESPQSYRKWNSNKQYSRKPKKNEREDQLPKWMTEEKTTKTDPGLKERKKRLQEQLKGL